MKLYPFIEAEKVAARSVVRACVLLKVSRSAYYAHRAGPSARQIADTELAAEITAVHTESKGRYGAPRVHAVLTRKGRRHGRKRIARLMAAKGLRGRAPKRWKKTTIADPAAAARLDLIKRDFTTDANRINTRWCGDITYIPTWEGWLFLATVIDITSRRVVGWATANHLRTELISDALANAIATREPAPGVIFHSDRGCPVHQYRVRGPGHRPSRHTLGRANRSMLGQRPGRVVLRLPQRRVPGPAILAHPGRRPASSRGVHRLVQRNPPAQLTELPHPRRIRSHHGSTKGPARSSLTKPTTLSVKTGQTHAPCSSRPP